MKALACQACGSNELSPVSVERPTPLPSTMCSRPAPPRAPY
jgi:hypothetical protein